MTSSVFYKFKSSRDAFRKVAFDGTGISIFDLKKAVILENNMAKVNDFDLYIFDSSTNQEYKEDGHILPRSSSVLIVRRPAAKPGKGKASYYANGGGLGATSAEATKGSGTGSGGNTWHKGAMSKRFDGVKEEQNSAKPAPTPLPSSVQQDEEAAAMAAMFQAQSANWEETQEKMSQATYIHWSGNRGAKAGSASVPQRNRPERPLPPSYVCYRCGQKGHWIQDCPTNNDREFDNKPRIKRTTGIPRSFLKAVENPTAGPGVMVTPEGGYVVAQPDVASWQKHLSRQKLLTETDVRERPPSDESLACPIDHKLFRDAVKTPCCGTTYCEDCIQTHLLERDFVCPNCGKKIPSLDKLAKDTDSRNKVMVYIDKAIETSKNQVDEAPESATAANIGAEVSTSTDDPDLDDQQLEGELDDGSNLPQIIADSVPQLQAQVQQLALMLQNPALPKHVRQQTEMQHQQLQMQLQHAQTIAVALAMSNAQAAQAGTQAFVQAGPTIAMGMPAASVFPNGMNMTGVPPGQGFPSVGGWSGQYTPQAAPQDSPYQRLPVNNRRRNLKRERPSDFVEVAGVDSSAKQPRYWE